MTPQELKDIEARANEATEGPWGQHDYDNDHCMITAGVDGNGAYIYVADVWDERDIPFIAHARQDIPNLLAYIAALTERLRAVEAERDEAQAEVHRLANGEGCNQCNDHIISLDEDLSALRAELERKDAALRDFAAAWREVAHRSGVKLEAWEDDEYILSAPERGPCGMTIHRRHATVLNAALQPKEPPCQKA